MIDLTGCGTALITPFKPDGAPDLDAFKKFIRWQIDSGINFLVPMGTTGEGVTLNEEEYRQVVEACVDAADGAVPVLAGAGTNNTEYAVHLVRTAEKLGASAFLAVTPYYNKPTPEGQFLHFQKIAQSTSLPVVLYNVPGRTAVNITAATTLRLAGQVKNIVGTKEASGDLVQIMRIIRDRPSGFLVLSGDDSTALAIIGMGGEGLISVASNVIPAEMARIVDLGRNGDMEEARKLHYRYLELMELNFIESNPIPVKYALSRMGRVAERYRLPLCSLTAASKVRMDEELKKLGLI